MPNRSKHERFDAFLGKKGVLFGNSRYGKVHDFMDKGTRDFGNQHRIQDFFHSEAGVRSWLNGMINVIGQDLATDWLRSALGHICLDEADKRIPQTEDCDKVFRAAHRAMSRKGYTRARFRAK